MFNEKDGLTLFLSSRCFSHQSSSLSLSPVSPLSLGLILPYFFKCIDGPCIPPCQFCPKRPSSLGNKTLCCVSPSFLSLSFPCTVIICAAQFSLSKLEQLSFIKAALKLCFVYGQVPEHPKPRSSHFF